MPENAKGRRLATRKGGSCGNPLLSARRGKGAEPASSGALPEEGASGRPLGKHMADEAGERGMSFSRAAGRGLSGRRSEEGISQEEDGGKGRDGRFFFGLKRALRDGRFLHFFLRRSGPPGKTEPLR